MNKDNCWSEQSPEKSTVSTVPFWGATRYIYLYEWLGVCFVCFGVCLYITAFSCLSIHAFTSLYFVIYQWNIGNNNNKFRPALLVGSSIMWYMASERKKNITYLMIAFVPLTRAEKIGSCYEIHTLMVKVVCKIFSNWSQRTMQNLGISKNG